jgi:hypothetical protein
MYVYGAEKRCTVADGAEICRADEGDGPIWISAFS